MDYEAMFCGVPKFTENDKFIEMVQKLLDKNYAYVADGNVYFDTSKLDEYYVFNKHEAENLEVGVREGVEEDTAKRNKTDFVLWFLSKKDCSTQSLREIE